MPTTKSCNIDPWASLPPMPPSEEETKPEKVLFSGKCKRKNSLGLTPNEKELKTRKTGNKQCIQRTSKNPNN